MILDNWVAKKLDMESELTRNALDKYQLNKLNELIKYVKENSIFYKEKYGDIGEIKSLDELKNIPITTKEDILKNGNKMVCVSQSEISRIVTLYTSGTTGNPKRIYFTEKDQLLTIDFFRQGLSLLVEKNDVMLIMLPGKRENSVGDLIKKALEDIEVKTVLSGRLTSFKNIITDIIEKEVNSIVGMPSEILALGRYINYHKLNIKIKSILLSVDSVTEVIVNEIKEAYNCEVFNHFGMTESGLGAAVDCKFHKGMHIRENDLLVEIVDPLTREPVKIGEKGEILITTLTREAMPLIRYATGDICNFNNEICGCKSVLKRLDNIKFRQECRQYIGENLYIDIQEIDDKIFKIKDIINTKISLLKDEKQYILSLELATLNKESYLRKEKLHDKIKIQLLSIESLKTLYHMDKIRIEISTFYTEEYVTFYNGKRSILK
ncbi:DVU_1553 family AMP-dependent CoA ligase [Terrisporobacter sp.]